jgi:hypothetical protein
MTWRDLLAFASPGIALASVFFVRRSANAARKALHLTFETSQVTYESAKAERTPPLDLFLAEIQYRPATARPLGGYLGATARRWAQQEDADELEVVIRGRLVNNLPRELLLTCRDHPNSGRTTHYTYRNQSVFTIDGAEVKLGNTVLGPSSEASFEWIDRRPRSDWISIRNLFTRNQFDYPEFRIPQLTWGEKVRAIVHREQLAWARVNKVKRSGFRLICETRSLQRVAAIWDAEVVQPPIESSVRDSNGRITFKERSGKIRGPLDDRIVHYRLNFDTTLAQINPPKLLKLQGRSSTVSYPPVGRGSWRR